MLPTLLLLLSIPISGGLAFFCYVLLYKDAVLIIQRPFFSRIGIGALCAAVIGAAALLVPRIPLHLGHAAFAVAVAAAVHNVQGGLHPDTETWFYSLFRG